MRLAMKLPAKDSQAAVANDVDPRQSEELDVIDSPAATPIRGRGQEGQGRWYGYGRRHRDRRRSRPCDDVEHEFARLAEPETVGQSNAQAPGGCTRGGIPRAATGDSARHGPAAGGAERSCASPVYAAPPMTNVAAAPAANPYSSPTITFDSSAVAPGTAEAIAAATGVAAGNPVNDFASRVGGVGGSPAQAKAMVNPATTVTQGTLIPAVLETAIDTNVPGYVRAVVSQDVRSFDGTRVLVPRSKPPHRPVPVGDAERPAPRLCHLDTADPARRRLR